jgi:hypothetical protein
MTTKIKTLECPHCGNKDTSKMEYVEDVLSTRTVTFEDGVLRYGAESTEHVEHAENARLTCKADGCWKDFPIPEGIEIDMECDV